MRGRHHGRKHVGRWNTHQCRYLERALSIGRGQSELNPGSLEKILRSGEPLQRGKSVKSADHRYPRRQSNDWGSEERDGVRGAVYLSRKGGCEAANLE